MGFFHSLPIPEIWEWIFLFPSRSRISGMGFFNSLPVHEPSKVNPAHPCLVTSIAGRARFSSTSRSKNRFCQRFRVLRCTHRRSVPFRISFCVEDISKTSVKKVFNWWVCVSISSGKLGSVSQIRILETIDKDNMRKQNHESWEYFRVSRSNQVIFVISSIF